MNFTEEIQYELNGGWTSAMNLHFMLFFEMADVVMERNFVFFENLDVKAMWQWSVETLGNGMRQFAELMSVERTCMV